jgi:hypothetical protein
MCCAGQDKMTSTLGGRGGGRRGRGGESGIIIIIIIITAHPPILYLHSDSVDHLKKSFYFAVKKPTSVQDSSEICAQ